MKRTETLWQIVVLSLVVLMTIGIYVTLGVLWNRVREGERIGGHNSSPPPLEAVQIVEPLSGEVFQAGESLPVRAQLMEPGFWRAELLVDGIVIAVQANPAPETAPWMVGWLWEGATEGGHELTVRARGPEGDVTASASLPVTVVPAGRLVFSSNRDGAYALYAMRTDGRNVERLTSGPGDARQPVARNDGVLAFVVQTETGQAMIRQMGGDRHETGDLIAGRDPAWSPDGASLAFAADPEGVSQVFVVSTAGAALAQVTHEEVFAGQPAWSPGGASGGERLAYVARREGNWDLWVTGLDGSGPRRLTDDPGRDLEPAWSPDGSRIAFVSDRGSGYQIYVMDADGSDVRPLVSFPQGAESPCWSPDGFWLAVVAYSGDGTGVNAREIYLVRADGRDLVRLTQNAFDDTEPAWIWGP